MEQTDLHFHAHDSVLTLGEYAERAYLDYAVSVVKGRALPDVCDGQKPVQRRILYAMSEMNLQHQAKPVKSARVVGDVLGKYHPHGDQSAYEALVRLAQDFSLRYPLIDGQGNFGSRDGDGAAAMRYTEARLTPIADLLLNELSQGTVGFMPNYDGSFEEPEYLPARLPFVLLNGASGIAVGLATEIPSHNLVEVANAAIALLKNRDVSDPELMQIIPGPDFPGGGQIISSDDEIALAYETGRGSLKVRARWHVETLARGQWQLVMTELPPNTSGQKILEEIEELTNPKIKVGKKNLTSEQQQSKQMMLNYLDAVRDESGKEAPVRLVFEPKSSRIDQEEFVRILLSATSLESSAPLNLVMIGVDGRPCQKGLRAILSEWLYFREQIVRARLQFRFNKIADRMLILEGRIIVFLHLGEVIALIRESDEPKAELMRRFHLSERQADDILEIRLRQLARLEKIKIEQELSELKIESAALEEILQKPAALKRLLIKEIEADAKQFGDARRTLIQHEKRTTFVAKVSDEPMTVVLSKNGWVRTLKGHQVDVQGLTFKQGDALYAIFECRTVDVLLAVGSSGRVYSVSVAALPGGRGDGVPVSSLIELEENTYLMHYFVGHAAQKLLLSSSEGYCFIAHVKEMMSRTKNGKTFINVSAQAQPLMPMPIMPNMNAVLCLSSEQRLLSFALSEVKVLASGGKGVKMMQMDEGQTLLQAVPYALGQAIEMNGQRQQKPQQWVLNPAMLKEYILPRARKGRVVKPAKFICETLRVLNDN